MKIDFSKGDGLVPAIIQDAGTGKVLMLGYMNEASYQKTMESGRVCFIAVAVSVCGLREKRAAIFWSLCP